MATSGIGVLLLKGGRTVHSRMKIPLCINEHYVCGINEQYSLDQLIQRVKVT